jgi:signal transduction histidine kinase
MLENLGIALRKQKKLVLIFFLTIFLPALTLSVFGVRAIRNERFRLAKQEENEGRRAARFIRAHVQTKIEAVASTLEGIARDPASIGKDRPAIYDLAEKRLATDPLIEQAVLLYKNEEVSFPLLLVPPANKPANTPKADASLAARIRKAEALEFVDRNFRAAAALYRELSTLAEGQNLQAEMLTGQARCLQKAEDYKDAVRVYARIASGYPDSLTPSGLPLGLLARLQAIECLERAGNSQGAAKTALDAYRELLKKPSALSEDQFKTYLSLVGEAIDAVLAGEKGAQISDAFRAEYADLKKLQSDRMEERAAAGLLRKEVIPELERRLSQSGAYISNPYRLSRNVGGRDLLFLAAWIPDRTGEGTAGIFGVQINSDHLKGDVLAEALGNVQLNDGVEVVLADLAGRPLSGKRNTSKALPLATEYFEDNFPPWKIELFQAPAKGLEILDLRRNFYFWTILTLIVVLAFGAFLIARTIGQEMEILKIKSDFVSSVSHEFKTPLTSIKALMERLVDGKVRDPGKMDQYFSIIAQDTDKLTRLVNNLLDFSKIEEGKKEYVFSDTDVVRIATEQVERFKKERAPASPDMRLDITGKIPTLRADTDALSRALANLLSNAVKFTPPGKAIRVGLSSDGENVVLEVEDEGIGIHPDEVGKVFEKFFQGRNALSQTVTGTGLGLTLVKHIIEAHGGRILVESRPGLGSKFSMVFPLKSWPEGS